MRTMQVALTYCNDDFPSSSDESSRSTISSRFVKVKENFASVSSTLD